MKKRKNAVAQPVPVKAQDGSNISNLLSTFAVDAISETVYAFSAANAAAEVLTIDMASGVVTSRVKLRKQLKITNMVFVGDDVIWFISQVMFFVCINKNKIFFLSHF